MQWQTKERQDTSNCTRKTEWRECVRGQREVTDENSTVDKQTENITKFIYEPLHEKTDLTPAATILNWLGQSLAILYWAYVLRDFKLP